VLRILAAIKQQGTTALLEFLAHTTTPKGVAIARIKNAPLTNSNLLCSQYESL
jgi:hypothetical protein